MNHPSVRRLAPTPAQIRAAREKAGLSVAEAAALIFCSARTWHQWETPVGSPGHRRMNPAFFEYFKLKVLMS